MSGAAPTAGGADAPAAAPEGIDAVDAGHLRRAIELSRLGRSRGNRPFGAVIVLRGEAGGEDRVLAEAWCDSGETGDCTGHAETNAVRRASPAHDRDTLSRATLYSSAEPCVMCAGAIFWAGLGRVVFGIDAAALRAFRGERLEQKDAALSCRDVFAAASHRIECVGPVLADEAAAVHEGFWRA